WDSTFAAVWHFAGSSLNDSTPHANNGTNNGSTQVAGQFGNARSFNGSTWVGVPDSPSLEIAPAATLEAWVKIADPNLNDSTRVVDKKVAWDGPQGYDLEVQPANNWITALGSGGTPARAQNVNLDTNWPWVSAVISGSTATIYVDGADRTTDSAVSPLATGNFALNIGRNPTGSYFQGAIDELRISNVARTPDWVHAQYMSMAGTFTTIDAEEVSSGLSATTSITLNPDTRSLAFQTSPTGLQLTVGGVTSTTPFNTTVITNSRNTIAAPSPQSISGNAQTWANWSDGGAQNHDVIATPSTTGFTAT